MKKRIHYLFVIPAYVPFAGGAQTFLQSMAQRLVDDGHRVTILTTNARRMQDFWRPPGKDECPLPREETLEGVQVKRLPLAYPPPAPYLFGILRRASHGLHGSGLSPRLQRPLLRRLSGWMPPLKGGGAAFRRLVSQADLVHAVDSSWDGLFTSAANAAHRYGKPFVAQPLMHLGDARVRAHFQMVHQVDTYRHADALLALSAKEAEALARLAIPQERIYILPMGIDPPPLGAEHAPSDARFRQEHTLQGYVVAFLGANTYDKGAFTLARAVARLNQEGEEVTLVCAGPAREELIAYLQGMPAQERDALRDRVRLLGLVDEGTKHRMLAACDLLALPSQVDAFGIVLLEAWLHAKPVIGADAGGIPELVTPGETGLLVPFGDVQALASAIRKLVTDHGLAARLGAAGRQRTLKHYTWERTYRQLLGVYESVLRSA
ncbi:MAG: hypothetical protein A2Y73_04795 [Chloroflexi bacterium RBG_13_56_8]|nr:MAG: hypothetical protein A2Y73_04795 [Chloroflexi bacterium RBG_13_56_8]